VVLPGLLTLRKEQKAGKLLAYARKVWGLHQGDDQVLVDEAIGRTILFFESLGVPTTLRDHGLPPEAADRVAERIAAKGWKLGEHQDIGPEEIRQILLLRAG
jgi:NADP-dependent alcohol dehydrogenase